MSPDDIRRLALALPEVVEPRSSRAAVVSRRRADPRDSVGSDAPQRDARRARRPYRGPEPPGGVCGVLVGQAAPCRAGGPRGRRRGAGARAVDRRVGAQGAEAAERREAVTRHGGAPWRGAGWGRSGDALGRRRSLATPARPAASPSLAGHPRRGARPRACSPADRQTQHVAPVQPRVRHVHSPDALTLEQPRVQLVRAHPAEAHDRERRGATAPSRAPTRTQPSNSRPAHVLRMCAAGPLDRTAQHRPELERPEAAAERGSVVHQRRRSSASGAQVLGDQAEGSTEPPGRAREQRRAVDRREHPLVRVDDERVGALAARERPAGSSQTLAVPA